MGEFIPSPRSFRKSIYAHIQCLSSRSFLLSLFRRKDWGPQATVRGDSRIRRGGIPIPHKLLNPAVGKGGGGDVYLRSMGIPDENLRSPEEYRTGIAYFTQISTKIQRAGRI